MLNQLPSGLITFLFTDIEGSTPLWEREPAAMRLALSRHNEIINEAVAANQGYVFKTIGDAFQASFSLSIQALNAAVAAQRGLLAERWPTSVPLKVRMGIHTGPAEIRENDYVNSLTLNRATRIMSCGHGGQTLISDEMYELIRRDLPVGIYIRDLGEHYLKGLSQSEHIYQVVTDDLPVDFPALKSLSAMQNNLPPQLTSFIGRQHELAEAKALLFSNRLVTLSGPGGTGKTRLALQVGNEVLSKFNDGVWLAELAPITDPGLIPQTIMCSVLGLAEQPGLPALNALIEYIRNREALLILDNCEHLVDTIAGLCSQLLRDSPRVKILATSRETLGIPGEAVYRVPSLSLPENGKHSLGELATFEAIQLFMQRASAVNIGFTLDETNASQILQICRRLDGIPLAIELAAARLRVLSLGEIAKRLDDRFRLLTGGSRTSLPRQQTLQALIDWSYELLSHEEKDLFERLAVFQGVWSLEAVEMLCPDLDVLDLLAQLHNKSLINAETSARSTRYSFLETIAQFARGKLFKRDDVALIRDRHLAYYASLAEQASTGIRGINAVAWLNRIEDEIDNFRLAMEWSFEQDILAGLRISSSLSFFGILKGYARELHEKQARLLAQLGDQPPNRTIVQALNAQASLEFWLMDLSSSSDLARRALAASREIADRSAEGVSLNLIGIVMCEQSDLEHGVPYLLEGLSVLRACGDDRGVASVLSDLGQFVHDYDQARTYAEESLAIYRKYHDLIGLTGALDALGVIAIRQGDLAKAQAWLEESLVYLETLKLSGATFTLSHLAEVAMRQGNYPVAREWYDKVLAKSQEAGLYTIHYWAQVNLGFVALHEGELEQSRLIFCDVIHHFHDSDITIGVVYAMEGLAGLATRLGQAERAATLLGFAEIERKAIADQRPPVEQAVVDRDIELIREHIDHSIFEIAYNRGKSFSLQQAIDFVLNDQTPGS